jgi:choice-of-anchor B domain-containing protein
MSTPSDELPQPDLNPPTVRTEESAPMKKSFILFGLLFILIGAAPATAQSFGASARVAGGDVLFGQPGIDREPGAVFVYRRAGEGWAEAAKLTASDGIAGDRFGTSIAVDGDRMIVGAVWADSGVGAAYVFERGSDGTWRETARLGAPGGTPSDSLGQEVALRGDLALVSYGAQPDSGEAGEVLAFRRQGSDWRPAGALTVTDLAPPNRSFFGASGMDRFGRAIALGDGFGAVSIGARDSASPAEVWIFPWRGAEWGEPVIVKAPENRIGYGYSLAFRGDQLLVGTPGLERGRGAVLVYRRVGDGWEEAGRIDVDGSGDAAAEPASPQAAEPAGPPLLFGIDIAAAEEVWIGALGADQFTGAIYRAREEGDGWSVEKIDLGIPELAQGDGLGGVVALGEGVAAVGLPGDDNGAGTGAIFEHQGESWAFAAKVFSDIQPLAAVTGGQVPCEGEGRASIFACNQVDLISFLPVNEIGGERGVELSDIWGWTDPETGKEYAIVGRTDGTAFVDISDSENPRYLGQLMRTEGSPPSSWREIKVYKNHALIVSDGAEEHGIQIFDLTKLRDVPNPPVTFTEDAHYSRVHSVHQIVVNEESGFAYAVGNSDGGETCGGGLHMIDIHDPLNPTFAGCFSDPRTGRQKTGYTHDAQCVIYRGPDEEYQGREICFGSNETALSIADVTDKQNPRAISVAEYPNVGYTHQTWLTDDHRYMVMDDELDELMSLVDHTRTLIWDVSDLDDPVLIKEFFNPNTTAIDHNQYIVGDKVYQSNYVTGLRVLDISDIRNPKEVGHFDTMPYGSDGPRFDGSWGNYPFFKSGIVIVGSGDEGLFVLKYRPAGERPVSAVNPPSLVALIRR